jgi:hypothetical protein
MSRGVVAVVALVCAAVLFGVLRTSATRDDVRPPPSPAPTPATAADPDTGDIVVSPSGDDSAAGTLQAPFATLNRAQEVARQRIRGMDRDVVIHLRGGTHAMSEPLRLAAQDAGQDGHDVVYRAYPGESPVLSGGIQVTGWSPVPGGNGLLVADVEPGLATRQLFVDGRRATRARSEGAPEGFTKTHAGYTTGIAGMQDWGNTDDIEIVGFAEWRDYHCPVEEITATELTVAEPCWEFANTEPPIEELAYVENARELLDDPGEWYHDSQTDEMLYLPRPGEDLSSADVVVGGTEQLVVAEDTHHVRIEGLTFAHTGWDRPSGPNGYAPVQTGQLLAPDDLVAVPGAVQLTNSYEIDLTGNTFSHLGTAGLVIDGGSRQLAVAGNRFVDIASHAASIGTIDDEDTTDVDRMHRDVLVSNNVITRIGVEYRDAPGIFLGYVRDVEVVHNEISEVPYSGIAMGWGWGRPSYARNNRIAFNRIDDYLRVLNDGGGVYTLSPQPGSEIHDNHITGNHGYYGCLYPDEGSAEMRWYRNVCTELNDAGGVSGQWLHLWISSIRDIEVTDNFTTTDELENDGTDIILRDNRVVPPGDLPREARAIVDAAGLEHPLRAWRG